MSDSLLVERRGTVDWLVLNRPHRLNAFDWELRDTILSQLRTSAEGDAEAVVLTGTGRGFCAGADTQDILAGDATASPESRAANLRRTHEIIRLLQDYPKPTFAVVDGVAAGGGWSLALATRTVIATPRARFVGAFASIALVPDMGALYLLPRRTGVSKALELFLLRSELGPQEALDCGAVDHLVEPEETAALVATLSKGSA